MWGFGVTVWELLSNGTRPFFDISEDDNVIRHVCGGGKLPDPVTVGVGSLWAAVKPCFEMRQKDRPTFAQLAITLGQVVVVSCDVSITVSFRKLPYGVEFEEFVLGINPQATVKALRLAIAAHPTARENGGVSESNWELTAFRHGIWHLYSHRFHDLAERTLTELGFVNGTRVSFGAAGHRACLEAGTLVTLAEGTDCPVEQLTTGMHVLTFDLSRGMESVNAVTQTFAFGP